MSDYKNFHGKILLFGEYTIIAGSRALVMPLKVFSGRLDIPAEDMADDPGIILSNKDLRRFFEYLVQLQEEEVKYDEQDQRRIPLNLDLWQMGRELDCGLYFHSSIPREYGAGSSAALVAAVYDAFASELGGRGVDDSNFLSDLREVFIRMETHFHGTSSGIDPVCSYIASTILLDGDIIHPLELPGLYGDYKLFLLDTEQKGKTAPLVGEFKQRLADDPQFSRFIKEELIMLVNTSIADLIRGNLSGIKKSLRKLSEYQLNYFIPMIPENIREIWKHGIRSDLYSLKLCGSGGGGYCLGFTDQWEKTAAMLEAEGKRIIPLDL